MRVSVCAGLSDAAYATGFAGVMLGYGKPRLRSRERALKSLCSHTFLCASAAAYDSLHFAIHHAHPLALERALGPFAWPAAEAFRTLQRRHLAHHRIGSRNYGVSSPLWDFVLGTALSSTAELKLRGDGDNGNDNHLDGGDDSEGGGECGGECGGACAASPGERQMPDLGVLVPAARARHAVVAP